MIKYTVDLSGVVDIMNKHTIYCALELAELHNIPFKQARDMVIHSNFEENLEYYQIHNLEIDYKQSAKNVYKYHQFIEEMHETRLKIKHHLRDNGVSPDDVHKYLDYIRYKN